MQVKTFETFGARYCIYVAQMTINEMTFTMAGAVIFTVVMLVGIALIVDFVRKRENLKTQLVRKVAYSVLALFGVCSFLPAIIYPCNVKVVGMAIATIGMTLGAIMTVAAKPVVNEMGGEYSGQVYALANTLCNLAGVIGPFVIGSILKRGEVYLLETWLPAFYLNLAAILLGAVIMWFGNYELLPWAATDTSIVSSDLK